MDRCWMNALHISQLPVTPNLSNIFIGCWCSLMYFWNNQNCVFRAFMTFSEAESMTKPRSDKEWGKKPWFIIDWRWPEELVVLFISTDVGRWLFPPVSCFLEKDHYQPCLAEINWIATTWVDVVSLLAAIVHLGNKNSLINVVYCCCVTAVSCHYRPESC